MNRTIEDVLRDVCLFGLNVIAQPRNPGARAALRRACMEGQAHLKALCEARRAEALGPRDPRPQPPLPADAPDPAPPAPARIYRSPYKED